MLADDTQGKIRDIASGAILEGQTDSLTTIRNFLCSRYPTSTTVKKEFESQSIIKKEQRELLIKYCDKNDFWATQLPTSQTYLTRGGEARVYLSADGKSVIKINDGIYYATWLEFLNSLLLHNLLFPNTSYQLAGFTKEGNEILAVLHQPFVIADAVTDLADIKAFLEYNGFRNTRRHDYENSKLGLILEDMHDENVLVNSDTLFFIDTVFYTVTPTILGGKT